MPFTSMVMGGVAAFNPLTLFAAGEKGFLFDPTNPSNLKQNSNGTTAVTTTGDPVGYIQDLSGNGNHATQATAGQRALFNVSGSVNSLAFNGITNSRYYNLLTTTETGFTSGMLLFAQKNNNDPLPVERNGGPALGQSGSNTSTDHYPWSGDQHIYHGFLSANRYDTGATHPSLASWHQGDFRSSSSVWGMAINGTDVYSTVSNTVATSTVPLIGSHQRNRGDGGIFLDGFLGRMIMINRVLTGSELTNARAWIRGTYS